MAIMSTLSGWVAVIALGGGYYYYVKGKQSKPAAPVKQSNKQPIEETKPKKEKAPKKKPTPKADKEAKTTSTAVYVDDGKDEVDNKEFARQLSNIKSGITPTAKGKAEKKQKSVKQSKAQEKNADKPVAEKRVVESSDNATGGDADDDESSVNSPELDATKETSPITVSANLPQFTLIPPNL